MGRSPSGGWLILAVMVAITLFYLVRCTIKLHEPVTGCKLLRFTPFERFVHWVVAIAFVLLAISGLSLLFDKQLNRWWVALSMPNY